jgi:hypothetical protein
MLCREYGRFILVSASASAGISQALLELMDIREGRGLTSQPIPRELVGRTFGELSAHFRSKGGGLVIGLMENTGQVLETKRKALREAQKTANVEQLVENLRKVRALVVNRPTLNPDDAYPISANSRALVLPRSSSPADEEG